MNVVSIIVLTLLVSFLQLGCSPVSVSLNSEFGLSLGKSPIEETTPNPPTLTVINQPPFINNANSTSLALAGTCENLDIIHININSTASSKATCSENHWQVILDSSNVTDGTVVIDFINADSKDILKTVTLEKDVVAPIALIDSTIPAVNNSDKISVSITQMIGSVQYSFKVGSMATTNCNDPEDYSNYIAAETSTLVNLDGDGAYRLCVLGKDSFGNEQLYFEPTALSWNLDTTPPTATLNSATSTLYINATTKTAFNLSVSCSDSTQKVKLVAIDETSLEIPILTTCSASNIASHTFDTSSLVDGTVRFSAIHTDAAGNENLTTTMLVVLKDTVGPAFPSDITDGDYFSSTASSPLVTWSAATDTGGSGINSYQVGFGTSPSSPNVAAYYNIGKALSVQKTFTDPLTEGTRYYTFIKASDAAGNFTVKISDGWKPDITPPNLTSFDDGIYSNVGMTPTISWSPSYDSVSGFDHYEVTIRASSDGSTLLPWTTVGSSTSFSSNVGAIVLGDTYYAAMRAFDKAGNSSPAILGDGFYVKPNISPSSVVANNGAFAAIMTNGKVICWGDPTFGGNYLTLPTPLKSGPLTVVKIVPSYYAFAALMSNGSVITWGDSIEGGDSSAVASEINGSVAVTNVISTRLAFAALRSDNKVISWGRATYGGVMSTATEANVNGAIPVISIYATISAFAALRNDGSVIAWGLNGGDTSNVASDIDGSLPVTAIYSSPSAFIAKRSNGSLVSWGTYGSGPTFSSIASQVNGTIPVSTVYSTNNAAAALRTDGTVITWGASLYGGDSSAVTASLSNVTAIFSTSTAFAALKSDGSLVTWGDSASGGDKSSVASQLTGSPFKILNATGTNASFAALRDNGSVIAWGHSGYGGYLGTLSASAIDGSLSAVTSITSSLAAFAAIRADGSVVTWGNASYGGDSASVAAKLTGVVHDVVRVYSSPYAFAAILSNGELVTWGDATYGGDSSSVNP